MTRAIKLKYDFKKVLAQFSVVLGTQIIPAEPNQGSWFVKQYALIAIQNETESI